MKNVNSYGTFEFIASKNDESVLVRVDNRSGLMSSNFSFENGDVVDIIGISGHYDAIKQLKPRMVSDITEGSTVEDEFLTVTDAIELEGEVTFRGYVVGNVRSRNHVTLDSSAYNNHNLLLANTRNETDFNKMLLVELKGKDGHQYGLVSNPSLFGQEIEITGERKKQKHRFEAIGNATIITENH